MIVLLVIKLFQLACFEKNKFKMNNILFLIPLLGLCISLKTYFLPYILIGFTIFLLDEKFLNIFKNILNSKSFFIFFSFLFFYFFHHFISTGCLISPLSFTCFGDNLYWAKSSESFKNLSIWLEQWSKAGAGPNFRIEDPLVYIQNFNWISNWIEMYFKVKILDQLGILVTVFFVTFLFFKRFKYNVTVSLFNKKILFFYAIVFIIFYIWFSKHPQLRYGGYSILFLTLSIPISILFNKIKNRELFLTKFRYFALIVIIIFNFKNFTRIQEEFERTDIYKYDNFPFFSIPVKEFTANKYPSEFIIYSTKGHCWNTPSPCSEGAVNKIKVKKNNRYYFLYK